MDLSFVRPEFPALAQTDAQGRPYVYLDGPGGTQVHQSVIDAMARYLVHANANSHGAFLTSRRTDETVAAARAAMADLFNAPSTDEIVFGANMTTLTFHISRTIGTLLQPGDEVVTTLLDHNANVAPWLRLAEQGVLVRQVRFHPEDCTIDMDEMRGAINPRTRVVAVGYASNGVGTINDVAQVTRWAHEAGAWSYVDAVHYAPHGPIDVQAIGCDFLVCSAYKFFGPHEGVLWGRKEILEQLRPDKVRPASDTVPHRFETGTQNHEAIAGTLAAVEYLASLGRRAGEAFKHEYPHLMGRRLELKAAMAAIRAYERALVWPMIAGLQAIPGLKVWGIIDPARAAWRAPTVSFTLQGQHPAEIARRLGDEGIFVWDGNYYALTLMEELGLEAHGGMVRVGLAHYNTAEEVQRLVAAVRRVREA
ncbi:MAG TPA: cysteine desulfurase-like protein [Anaerolineae bacterium]|nr:cysteine desulfurase-like protein [Anaerolineae bacterium]HOQ97703.1 cysteine desulfurase-like protein [Anaerolineae bacterium]HPL26851.1 cysteine desulfurase-like protein [Anaerolineae bacterium]